MKVKILNIDTLYVNEIINILNCDGICKVSNDKKITPNDFLNFCKKFLLITPLTKNDPDIIKVSKNTTFSTYDLPWHQEGSHYENNIISVTYNYKNCEKFPTEFINTNTIVKEFCNDLDYYDRIEITLKDWGRVKRKKENSEEWGWFWSNKNIPLKSRSRIKVLTKSNDKFYLFINPKYTDEILNDDDNHYFNLIKKFDSREQNIEKFKLISNIKSNEILIYDNSKIIHTRPKNIKNFDFDRELWRITGILMEKSF